MVGLAGILLRETANTFQVSYLGVCFPLLPRVNGVQKSP